MTNRFDSKSAMKLAASYDELKAMLPKSIPSYQRDRAARNVFKRVISLSASVTAYVMDVLEEQVPDTSGPFGELMAMNSPSVEKGRTIGTTLSQEFMAAIVRFVSAQHEGKGKAPCNSRTS